MLAGVCVLDVLSSDYFPGSLLDGVFKLAADERNQFDLASAAKLATLHPAQALGMDDRGVIEEGRRADLILVNQIDDQAYVQQVWTKGNRVF